MRNFLSNLRFYINNNNILVNIKTFNNVIITLENLSLKMYNDCFKVNFKHSYEIANLKKLNQHLNITDLFELPFKDIKLIYIHPGLTLTTIQVTSLISTFLAFYLSDIPLTVDTIDQLVWQIRYNNPNDPRDNTLTAFKKSDEDTDSFYDSTRREIITLYKIGSQHPVYVKRKPKRDETILTAFYTKINNDILEIYI